jgi:hypothetical protein
MSGELKIHPPPAGAIREIRLVSEKNDEFIARNAGECTIQVVYTS